VFENKIKAAGVPFMIESFRKTSGQTANLMGREGYMMDVEAVVRFPRGINAQCLSKGRAASSHWGTVRTSIDCATIRNSNGIMVEVGGQTTIRQRLGFEKTEQGWRGVDGRDD
jgi:hypothetical protein